jgi:hypothetical protein
MGMISKKEYEEFLKDYTIEVLRNSDYRLGQAFLNYFPAVNRLMNNDGDLGAADATKLYHTTDNDEARGMIQSYLSD